MRVDLPPDKKIVENQDRVTGPPGRRGLPGLREAGPLDRRGPRAAGRLLAKPDLPYGSFPMFDLSQLNECECSAQFFLTFREQNEGDLAN